MKKTTLALVISLFTANTLFATAVQAEGPGPQGGHDQQHQPLPRHNNDQHGAPQSHGGQPHAQPAHAPAAHHRSGDHFAWNGQDFRRGHAVPQDYRGDHYRVNDWKKRGLRQPPSGQHWAYINGNYVLIAAATGIITSILLNAN